MTGARIALPLGLAVAMAIAALAVVPRGFDADQLLSEQNDPVALADRAIARSFDASVAAREINAALAADDADLAQSFLELARDRNVAVDPALAAKVERASADAASVQRSVESFTRGLITGEPDDLVGFAGTALGDLFVFGDIRDAVREGGRLASGQEADQLILGLACVGLAVTAGTYATIGAGAPARVGLSVIKAARKTGRMGPQLAAWTGRSLRDIVDAAALRGVSLTNPVLAVRTARSAVKLNKADGLVRFVGDIGRVQSKAGTRAALDGVRLAERPRDMARIAKLAERKGSKTRAILKLLGRGAIMLTIGLWNLTWSMFWALLSLIGFVSSLKTAAERATLRHIRRRKAKRARLALAAARG
jgi:hypothetical protein